jgi:apolipoprotein N-acyltransferase
VSAERYYVSASQRLLARVRNRVIVQCKALASLAGWTRRIVAFALGALSVLAVAPVFAWPVLFVTLPVFFLLLHDESESNNRLSLSTLWRAALTGWWFGFGYFLTGLHWIIEPFLVEPEKHAWLVPFAITLLPGGLALFYALAAGLARLIWVPGWRSAFPLAASFGIAEWLRGTIFTGFPWNPLGHGLTGNDLTLQWSSVVGVNGLTILTVIIYSLPMMLAVSLISQRTTVRTVLIASLIGAGFLAVGLVYGVQRQALTIAMQPGIQLRLVQPAIPQSEKWAPGNQRAIFDQLLLQSKQNGNGNADGLAGTTHVIWPESAIPFLLLRTPQALKEIAELLPAGTTLITGASRIKAGGDNETGERQTFNSLLAFDSRANLIAQYDKQHLVPFGEYLPFQSILEGFGLRQLTRLRGGFTPGRSERFMALPGTPSFAPLVCYEGIFSGDVVTSVQRPEWLLIVTNDAWFGAWAGPRQHFHHARIRAVEEGLPIIRVSNNGISAAIGPTGKLQARLDVNVRGTLDVELPGLLPPTIFARVGNVAFWILLVCCILFSLGAPLARNRSVAQP